MLYNFLIKNLIISIILILSILILIIFEINEFIKSKNGITTETAIDLINHKNAIIIDVRPEIDFNTCHIANSINIPDHKIEKNKQILKKYKKKHIIIIHKNNTQAQKTVKNLMIDLENVSYIKDGMDSWTKKHLLTKSTQ